MSGINLLLSAICLNSTFCPNQQPIIGINSFEALPRDNFKTTEAFNAELKIIAAELKGKILNVTTLEDFPLSYVEKNNKTGEFVGKGKS